MIDVMAVVIDVIANDCLGLFMSSLLMFADDY